MSAVVFTNGLDEALEQSQARETLNDLHLEIQTLNDAGDVARMIERGVHETLKYVPGLGWISYDGIRWVPDSLPEAQRAARDITAVTEDRGAEVMRLAYSFPPNEAQQGMKIAFAMKKHAREGGNASSVNGVVKVMEFTEEFVVPALKLDADPDLFNLQNGTLEIGSLPFNLRPHSPDDLITKVAACSYDPENPAIAPHFLANVARFLPNVRVSGFVQRWFGAAMQGTRLEESLFGHGDGANYKSTLLRAVREAFGDYGGTMDPDQLVDVRGRKSVSDKAGLARQQGKRLVTFRTSASAAWTASPATTWRRSRPPVGRGGSQSSPRGTTLDCCMESSTTPSVGAG